CNWKDPISPGGREFVGGNGGGERDHARAGGFAGADPGGDVFDHDAVAGREAEGCGPAQVGVGGGFAVDNVVGSDEVARPGEAAGAEARQREGAGAGGDDGPAFGRERRQQCARAWKGLDAGDIGDLAALDFAVLGNPGGGIGEIVADGGEAGAAVGAV